MKVSIIIPVYNTEKYLERCVDSCLNQTLSEVEIILIDDCSNDGSREIILKYAGEYPDKVRYLFQKENHRQGAARNRGMEIAEGEYFLFVDSDDWLESDMCEALYKKALEYQADMVGSDCFYSWDDRDEIINLKWHDKDVGNMSKTKKEYLVSTCGLFCFRIYSSRFLKDANLTFPEDIFYEDTFFNFYSILMSSKVLKVDKAFYHYYQGNKSTVRNRNNPHQYERIDAVEYIYNFSKGNSNLQQYKDLVFKKYVNMSCSNVLYICLCNFDKPSVVQLKRINDLISEKDKNYTKSESFKELDERVRFFSGINAISSYLCVLSYKLRIYDIINKLKQINIKKGRSRIIR